MKKVNIRQKLKFQYLNKHLLMPIFKQTLSSQTFIPMLNFEIHTKGDISNSWSRKSVKNELLRRVKKAAFGMLTDEVADVSLTENLKTFVQYYCREKQRVETSFQLFRMC